jgi:hypothetical protein
VADTQLGPPPSGHIDDSVALSQDVLGCAGGELENQAGICTSA